MSENSLNNVSVDVVVKYTQDEDSCSKHIGGLQELKIETMDAGGGQYYVLSTKRWAFESLEELNKVLNDFIKRT